jgi:hypothetical protein
MRQAFGEDARRTPATALKGGVYARRPALCSTHARRITAPNTAARHRSGRRVTDLHWDEPRTRLRTRALDLHSRHRSRHAPAWIIKCGDSRRLRPWSGG